MIFSKATAGPALNALGANGFRFAWLVNLGGEFLFTDNETNLNFSGNEYLSGGELLGLSSVTREKGIRLQSYSFTLSGVHQETASRLLFLLKEAGEPVSARNVAGMNGEVWLALLDEGGRHITQTIKMYQGTLQSWKESDSGSSVRISITLASPWSKPTLTKGRFTSDDNQQQLYPGDGFFAHAHREIKSLGWGADG